PDNVLLEDKFRHDFPLPTLLHPVLALAVDMAAFADFGFLREGRNNHVLLPFLLWITKQRYISQRDVNLACAKIGSLNTCQPGIKRLASHRFEMPGIMCPQTVGVRRF